MNSERNKLINQYLNINYPRWTYTNLLQYHYFQPITSALTLTFSARLHNWTLFNVIGHLWMRNYIHNYVIIKIIHSRRNMFIMVSPTHTKSIWLYSAFTYKTVSPKLRFLLWNRILRTIIGLLRRQTIRYIKLFIFNRNIRHSYLLKHAYYIFCNSKRTGVRLQTTNLILKKPLGLMRPKKIARRKRRLQRRATLSLK